MTQKRISIVGCGFVADYYMLTLTESSALRVAGMFDLNEDRARKLADHYGVEKVYASLDELLADDTVEIALNLTNPRSHYDVTKACLKAGKHVYTEKPLGMTLAEAKELAALAKARGLQLSSAPSSLLGEAAQTLWKALRSNAVGPVRLAYAELDDGLLHRSFPDRWVSSVGVGWPHIDEYEIGCTLEHAGYYLTWLAAFFGPARRVTAFGSCLIPAEMKAPGVALDPPDTPDFTVACIEYVSGAVARLTCGIVAPRDHSLTLIGDEGVLRVEDCWKFGGEVRMRPRGWNQDAWLPKNPLKRFVSKAWRHAIWRFPFLKFLEVFKNPHGKIVPPVRDLPPFQWRMGLQMDFSRGVEELAASIDEGRDSRLSTDFSLHLTELALAIHHAPRQGQPYEMTTAFDRIEPMPWAQ